MGRTPRENYFIDIRPTSLVLPKELYEKIKDYCHSVGSNLSQFSQACATILGDQEIFKDKSDRPLGAASPLNKQTSVLITRSMKEKVGIRFSRFMYNICQVATPAMIAGICAKHMAFLATKMEEEYEE